MKKRFVKKILHSSIQTSLLLLFGTSTVTNFALAQENEEGQEGESIRLEEIVVTGSRIQRDGFQAVNSTMVITGQEMEALGVNSVSEMMLQMPANIGRITPQTVGDAPTNIGGTIADLRGLNTSTGSRTLTLVNSRRYVATNDGGSTDLSVIPSALIGQMETVTGGASATYGSDALAGVVNIILDTDLDGVRLQGNWSQYGEGDGDQTLLSLAAGTGVLNDKGHITVAFEHSVQDGIDDCASRAFCARSLGLFTNGSAGGGFFAPPAQPYAIRTNNVSFPGQPHYIVREGLRWGVLGTGNVWRDNNNTGQYYTFNEAGTALVPIWTDLTAQEKAAIISAGSSGVSPFGTGDLFYAGIPFIPEQNRDTFLGAFSYEFDNGIEVETELSYANVEAIAKQNSNRQMNYAGTIQLDNAFLLQLSQADQDILTARQNPNCTPRPYVGGATVACIPIEKVWSDQMFRQNSTETETMSFTLAANGPIGATTWNWDAYVNWGNTDRQQNIQDWATTSRWQMAQDAVIGPNGDPICRIHAPGADGDAIRARWLNLYSDALGITGSDTTEAQAYVDNISAGCVPINVFGYAASEEAMNWSWPDVVVGTDTTQKQASVTFSGEVYDGIGAGPFQAAVGIDWYENTVKGSIPGNFYVTTDYLIGLGGFWNGRTTNVSPFVELELPLLANKPGAKYLMTNLAFRQTENETERLGFDAISSSRNIESWKVSVVWQPIDSVRFRLTRSSDVRAPSARELYRETIPGIGNAFTGASVNTITNPFVDDDPNTADNESQDTYRSLTGGNAALESESAVNETIGVVFTPGGMFDGLRLSADYYETTIDGGITTLGGAATLNNCYFEITQGVPASSREFCPNIVFGEPASHSPNNPYSNIETIGSSQINAQEFISRGVDYSASYFLPLSGDSSLNFRLMATRFLEQSVDLGGFFGRTNVSGQVGGNAWDSFFGGVGNNYTPTPDLQGNFWTTFSKGPLASTLQVRYISRGRLNNQSGWIGPGEEGYYTVPATGELVGPIPYDPARTLTIDNPEAPSWVTYGLHFNYDFARSRFAGGWYDGMRLSLNIDNILDKMPNRLTGRDAGGINTSLYSGLGRRIQLGFSLEF